MLLSFNAMEFLIVIIIIIGGLLFIYFNIKFICKFNITATFINIFFDVLIFKKNITIIKKIDYNVIIKKIIYRKNNKAIFEKYKQYLRYSKYPFKIFIIKNISIYEQCFEDKPSLAIEFYIVNKVINKSL